MARGALAGALAFCAAGSAAQDGGETVSPNRGIYLYQGADRSERLVERARREQQVMLYSSLTVGDGRALAAAFERKYGIKVVHWRASAEKIVSRAVTEARARRHEVDVIEASANQMEALQQERLLEEFFSPVLRELVPAAFPRRHRQYFADRFVLFVMGYNTNLVKPEDVPAAYEDLLHPRWTGRVAIEATDVLWFAAVTRAMGEERGLGYFRKLAALKPEMRTSHILTAQLVAAGEVPLFLTAYHNNMETLKLKGAPVDWKPLQPAFGLAAAIGVARHAPRPHAALLFAEFVLSREGQEILRKANRIPSNGRVEHSLGKLKYGIIDPELALGENEKWSGLFSELFLGGRAVQQGD